MTIAALACLVVGGCIWLKGYMHDFYMARVPPGVQVEDIEIISTEFGCGAVIYRLKPSTTYFVRPQGSGDLPGALGPPWAETPIPRSSSEDAGSDRRYPVGLSCAKRRSRGQERRIADAASAPGSFYLAEAHRVFILMPRERWLVFAFSD